MKGCALEAEERQMKKDERRRGLRLFLALHRGPARISARAVGIVAAVECVAAAYLYLRLPSDIGWMVFGMVNAVAFVYLFGKYYSLVVYVMNNLGKSAHGNPE
jgi:hypothetical protein